MERNVEETRLERDREIISENAYAAINNRFSDMREKNMDSAGQMQPSDAVELARADAMDLAKISKPELAANASDIIAYNMANSADYQVSIERTLNELDASNAANAALARQSVEQGQVANAEREAQANAREAELQLEREQRAQTAAYEQRRDRMTDEEKRAEFAATPDQEAAVRAQTDAAIAARLAEADYSKWNREQQVEHPERHNNLNDEQRRAEYAVKGTEQAAEVVANNDAALNALREQNAAYQLRRSLMTDEEKRAEFAAPTPDQEAAVRTQTDAAIAARQAEADYSKWNREQQVEHPERHNSLNDEQRRAEYAVKGTEQAAEVIAANDAAVRALREQTAAYETRRFNMTDEEKRAEFDVVTPDPDVAANTPSVEQEIDRQLQLNEGERLAEKEAVTDADLASVRADNDAAVSARAMEQSTPEIELDPFGPPLEEVAASTPGDARAIEQEMDRQLQLDEGERLAEKEAVTDADLASVRSANDAAIAARALDQSAPEPEADPFGPALDDAPQASAVDTQAESLAESEQDAANMIEPVSIREAVNDSAIPVKDRDAANEAQNGEEIVLDEQTLAHLARARAADRLAAEQQLGHTGDELRPAPQPVKESATPEFVDRRSRDNQVESDEIMTANRETRKPVLPPEIERQYVSVGTKYYDQKKPDVVAFEDKGNRLETRSNNEEVAANLVKIAESRGWDEIKVSGSETFRKEVWAEAASRGMQVKGYTPTEQDKASLAARMQAQAANKVEPVKEQDKTANTSPEKQRAESFQKDSPEVALKKHPELAGAYAAQAAMQKKMDADRLSPEQQSVVKARVNKNIVNSIEAGKIPEVNRREELTKHREAADEKELSR